jgi:two-component system LytT family sensor kinase
MSNNENQHWYVNNKKIKVFIHGLVWVILIVLPNILNKYRLESMGGMMSQKELKFIQLDSIMYVYWIGAYYYNSLVLVPRLLLKGKNLYYILIILALLFFTIFADNGIRMLVGIPKATVPIICYFRFPILLLVIAAGIAFTVVDNEQKYQEKINETDKEGLKTELSFLRSQMSPHFIFNVLNNIVSLVRLKSDELEPTVMKLSGLMQYTLYHTEDEKVSLKTEVEYLKNYIDLQKQRFSKKAKIEATFDLYDEHMMIEPLLLIPFVENAFKHGAGVINDSKISILLKTDEQNLYFTVVNKFDPSGKEEKDPSSGIGIANVSRRLELLYGSDHQLNIAAKGNNFETGLFIKLRA